MKAHSTACTFACARRWSSRRGDYFLAGEQVFRMDVAGQIE